MKKLVPIAVLVVVLVLVVYLTNFQKERGSTAANGVTASKSAAGSGTGSNAAVPRDTTNNGVFSEEELTAAGELIDDEEIGDSEEDRPASEVYKSADDALQAIKQASLSYDDLVLEQFTMPGDDCTWCPQFYTEVRGLILNPEINSEQRSYFAEVLAVSGKIDNIKAIVDAIKSSPSKEQADSLAEALELTVGRDDVVQYLSEHLTSDNQTLRESSVAAVTNQGSRLAVDVIYKNTVERGDSDGYYSLGMGLGELVPDDEALPRLQEIMLKRDQYSHLGVKALLNSGSEGLKLVFDAISSSTDSESDKALLRDAIDHVPWDDDVIAVVDNAIKTSKNPAVLEFAQQIKEELRTEEDDLIEME